MKYISIPEATRLKNVSRSAIYQAIAISKIDTEKIAGRIVIIDNGKFTNYKPKIRV